MQRGKVSCPRSHSEQVSMNLVVPEQLSIRLQRMDLPHLFLDRSVCGAHGDGAHCMAQVSPSFQGSA